jgi:hypothetical protein
MFMHIVLLCLSVRMIQLEKRRTDLNEFWYERYAIGCYHKLVLFNFLQSIIPTWRKNEIVR